MTRVLGIETSCDETAAAVVSLENGRGEILSSVVLSQIAEHAAFGGVVPEIAARAHVEALDGVVSAALADAGLDLAAVDAIAVTAGPGLIGGLIVGVMTAKALAAAADKELIAVNHLEGHALTARLTDGLGFPYLLLLVSGGHTQIVLVREVGRYERWATTIDDALGEAFDKTAKLLSLPYPGGPSVEKAAARGDAARFALPRPLKGEARPDFSFASRSLAFALDGRRTDRPGIIDRDFYVAMNASHDDLVFKVPASPSGREWHRLVDTALAEPDDFNSPDEGPTIEVLEPYQLRAHSMLILMSTI